MTRTTRPARTTVAERRPKRIAPRYPALKADAYADLPLEEKQRADAHLDLDAIFDAIPRATLDRDSVGFPTTYRPRDGSPSTDERSLIRVSKKGILQVDPAADWLAEAAECRALVTVVGAKARSDWPPVFAAGTVVSQDGEQITVGGRGNQVPICSWCGDPAPSGRDPETGITVVRKIGDHAVHTKPCYQQASRLAGKGGTTLPALLLARVLGRKSA